MATSEEMDKAKFEARYAILKGIADAVEDLSKHNGPAQAEGLKNLAEAYARMNNMTR